MASETTSKLPTQEKKQDEGDPWEATLPFTGIVGREEESVDLFSCVTNFFEKRDTLFDRKQWPPTKAGLKKLLYHLQQIGLRHGSEFNVDISKGILVCNRFRKYRDKKYRDRKKHKNNQDNDDRYDDQGGQTGARAIHTSKDLTGDKLCKCRFKLKIHKQDQPDGFIYVSCRGNKCHSYHPKPEIVHHQPFAFNLLNKLQMDPPPLDLASKSIADIQQQAANIQQLCTNQKSINVAAAVMTELEEYLNHQNKTSAALTRGQKRTRIVATADMIPLELPTTDASSKKKSSSQNARSPPKKARKEETSNINTASNSLPVGNLWYSNLF
ncbi:unnamed protein product [Cylindrotheca closterium]|uniref:Uncharacterized protein n=1 Tax=Cylindrotheca closterium TaxID=2856 RepID=A0AAD2CZB7_9STRA|nr:unnamed protein product [Cylindrotheca closterium]